MPLKKHRKEKEVTNCKQPQDYINPSDSYSYLGHFAQDRFLERGHNEGIFGYNDVNPAVQAPTRIIPTTQGSPTPLGARTFMGNAMAPKIVFPTRVPTAAPQAPVAESTPAPVVPVPEPTPYSEPTYIAVDPPPVPEQEPVYYDRGSDGDGSSD